MAWKEGEPNYSHRVFLVSSEAEVCKTKPQTAVRCIKVDHLNWPRRSVHGPQLVGTMEELQQPRVACPATCHVYSLLPTNRNILPERLNDKDLKLLLGLYGLCYYAKQSH